MDKLALIRARTLRDKLLGWNEGNEAKGLRIVIFQGLFNVESFNDEIKEKFVKYLEDEVGEVERSRIFQYNPDGVMEVKFKKASNADNCIETMDGKVFNGRSLRCFFWDGKTDYRKVRNIGSIKKLLKKRKKEFKNSGTGWKIAKAKKLIRIITYFIQPDFMNSQNYYINLNIYLISYHSICY